MAKVTTSVDYLNVSLNKCIKLFYVKVLYMVINKLVGKDQMAAMLLEPFLEQMAAMLLEHLAKENNMSKATAYFQGQEAWLEGTRNPYPLDTEEWQSWERGWLDENLRQECQADVECD